MVTHFIVAADVARFRDFYSGVLGGTVVLDGEPTIIKLANGWVIINVGGDRPMTSPRSCWNHRPIPLGPAPSSTFGWPVSRPSTRSGAPAGRVPHPPKVHSREIRCDLRDPDGHLIEAGQTTGVPS